MKKTKLFTFLSALIFCCITATESPSAHAGTVGKAIKKTEEGVVGAAKSAYKATKRVTAGLFSKKASASSSYIPSPSKDSKYQYKPKTTSEVHASRIETIESNRNNGKLREIRATEQLEKEHPNTSIQNEQFLRNKNGEIAKDPLTGEARRIDHVVIDDGKVIRKVETTSQTASKDAQIAKEMRIMQDGGKWIRDRDTGKLIKAGPSPSEVIRRD